MTKNDGNVSNREPTATFNKLLEILYPAILLTAVIGLILESIQLLNGVTNTLFLVIVFLFASLIFHIVAPSEN